jgi:hypothetical protein
MVVEGAKTRRAKPRKNAGNGAAPPTRRAEPPQNAANAVTRSLSLPIVLIAFGLITLLLSAGVLVTYFAYDRQASKVETLEGASQKIQMEHLAVGGLLKKRDQQYDRELKQAMAQAEAEFQRGFRAGKSARKLPPKLQALAEYASEGLRVPRSLPPQLATGWRVRKRKDGYALRWAEISVFASSTEPLRVWTRQGWPGYTTRVKVGGRRVLRVLGPYGVMFAWREAGDTYAVLSYPQRQWEMLARRLITSMA